MKNSFINILKANKKSFAFSIKIYKLNFQNQK